MLGGAFDCSGEKITAVGRTDIDDDSLKDTIVQAGGIAGIYQSLGDDKPWKIACFKNSSNEWEVIHLSNGNHSTWQNYETKGCLEETAVPGTWMATVYDHQKNAVKGCIAVFEGATLTLTAPKPIDNQRNEMVFIKMFPTATTANDSPKSVARTSGGTGFPLKNGYIVTNWHVVDGMDWIKVYRGDETVNAQVAFTDKKNDIAVLRTSLDTSALPFGVATKAMKVGEKVYALGYPLTATMGKNVKLTDGIVNAVTGFSDDETQYQISAAVQPGNSGGPLFDAKGNLAGIVSAKHLGAENVNYAIKISYLKVLLENNDMEDILPAPQANRKDFTDRVEEIQRYVCRIECGR